MNYNTLIEQELTGKQFGQHKALVQWGYTCFAKVDSPDKDMAGYYYRREDKAGRVAMARITPKGAVEHLEDSAV